MQWEGLWKPSITDIHVIGIFIVLATSASAGFNLLGVPMFFEIRHFLFKVGVLASRLWLYESRHHTLVDR